MRDKVRAWLRSAVRVLLFGIAAALGLGLVTFLFALLTSGLELSTGLDWPRRVLLMLGAVLLVVGGCGLLTSGRDRPDDPAKPGKDPTFQNFWNEVGLPWGAAVALASVGSLAVGSLCDLLYLWLAA